MKHPSPRTRLATLWPLLAAMIVLGACAKSAQPRVLPGREIPPEPGAEDGANRAIDGRVAISDAELKAAARRVKAAQEEAKAARGRKNQQQQRGREKEDVKERETEKLTDDGDLDGAGGEPRAKKELKALPRNPNPPATVAAPDNVSAPPADAQRTPAGVWHKVLVPGKGTEHPVDDDQVVVHYTGWTVDGKMFDSSVVRGQPIRLGLNQVIAGWRDGVRLMVVGETRRLWIPESMAYQGRAGAPKGMLVFDVELIDIEAP